MGQGIRDVSTSILGYTNALKVSAWLTTNQSRVEAAGLSTPGQARRALNNEVIDGVELKVLRGRTFGLDAILDSGVSVSGYYNTIIGFYSTPEGRKFGNRLDRWAQSGQVSEAEISYMTQQVYKSAIGGMTPQELARLDSEMDRLDNPGNRATVAAPAKPATIGGAPPKPQPTAGRGGVRTFTDEVNDFKRGANSTTDEELFLQQRIARDKASDKKWTNEEVEQERALMARLSKKGDQLTAAERASIVRPIKPDDGRTDPPTDVPPPPATDRITPAEPPKPFYSPPNTLNMESYSELVVKLGDNLNKLMPEGMADSNDAKGFLAKLDDPVFAEKFIRLYNSDPQYRQAIQLLYRDSAKLAEMKGKGGGELDPDSEIGRRAGLLTGQFRTVISNPEDLLNVNKVMELQQGVSGLANFAGSMSGMLDQMPPWLRGLLAPVWDFIENVIGPLFSKQGLNEGLAVAGNAAGQLFNSFGGGANAGAGSGALAPRGDLAVAEPLKPNAIKPDALKPGMDAAPVNV